VANYGEDREAASLAAKKAEGFFRCLLENPPADRKRTTQELEDLKAHLANKGIQLPSHLDMYLAVLEGISGVLRALPTHHLKVLKSRIALETVLRDDEEIPAGFTIGELKDTIALLVKTNEYTMSTAMQNARARVFRGVEEILHPYEEFLTANHEFRGHNTDFRRGGIPGKPYLFRFRIGYGVIREQTALICVADSQQLKNISR